MNTLYFSCKLLTDVILNQCAATEGNQESLDFIPGNNFLGIVAGVLYPNTKITEPDKLTLFHSGKVRFGDAHPERDGKRALRIPSSFFYPKLDESKSKLYVHHEMEASKIDFQPKQCRTGFYLFENFEMEAVKVEKSFAIKSAYDRDYRRSKDEAMYGYESLQEGISWIFEVAVDQDVSSDLCEQIKTALIGEKRIGRSRTAQYGMVEIEFLSNYKPVSYSSKTNTDSDVLVYADGRLIFLDEYGLPTFQPTAEQLGLKAGVIDWSKSQIRTFQYAPWNFKRRSRDTDRCGIEKGSVFYVKNTAFNDGCEWIGSYQNEGFGKVIYNPMFLEAEPNSNGKAKYKIIDAVTTSAQHQEISDEIKRNPLFNYLQNQQQKESAEQKILKEVNEFVARHKDKYTKESFASQWGTIRSIAIKRKTKTAIMTELFDKTNAYLTHGVAKDKWDERKRRDDFQVFIKRFNEHDFQSALINLASEMAKIAKQ